MKESDEIQKLIDEISFRKSNSKNFENMKAEEISKELREIMKFEQESFNPNRAANLYVKNIDYALTKDDLKAMFERFQASTKKLLKSYQQATRNQLVTKSADNRF